MNTSSAGYSGTPLVRKLGIKPGMTCSFVDPPDNYSTLLVGVPDDLTIHDAPGPTPLDFVHLFTLERAGLDEKLARLRDTIAQNGMIWVSWPKKSSGVQTDLTGDVVRRAGLGAGLVDVKVCAVDGIWSGLKFVIPVADRR